MGRVRADENFRVVRGWKDAEWCRAKCRDCGEVQRVEKHDFRRASPPRCSSCGGMLDKITQRNAKSLQTKWKSVQSPIEPVGDEAPLPEKFDA